VKITKITTIIIITRITIIKTITIKAIITGLTEILKPVYTGLVDTCFASASSVSSSTKNTMLWQQLMHSPPGRGMGEM
jgi:hypothetical protein